MSRGDDKVFNLLSQLDALNIDKVRSIVGELKTAINDERSSLIMQIDAQAQQLRYASKSGVTRFLMSAAVFCCVLFQKR